MSGLLRRKGQQKRFRFRLETLLSGLVILMAIMIIGVNSQLWQWQPEVQTPEDHNLPKPKPVLVVDKKPLVRLMKMANVNVTPELYDALPSWQQVVDRIGDKPVIHGLERCAAFNEQVPLQQRIIAPAGAFNTGTNLLYTLLHENCVVSKRQNRPHWTGVEWQVNWGKHQPPRFRFENHVHPANNANYLPIVILRDPYTWFQSMCRTRYAAHWYHVVPHHCPNFIPNHVEREWFNASKRQVQQYYNRDIWKVDNILDKAHFTLDSPVVPAYVRYKSATIHHKSLVHMWKDWYQEYFDADFPRLIIRLEDLVFFPEQVLSSVCSCVEGTMEDEVILLGNSAKEGSGKVHGTNKTTFASSMTIHTHTNRTKGMTPEDREFAKSVLEDSVMTSFGYSSPAV